MIHCKFDNGNDASLRHVVVDVLVLKDEKLLMVKRTAKLSEGGKWALVGGYVERDENIKATVCREVFEETGYRVSDIHLLTIRDNPDRPHENVQNISFVYFCSALEKEGKSDWEVDEQKWVAFDALPPDDQIAFDHVQDITLYLEHKEKKLVLPVLL